jgi:hypothetical protein
MGGKVRGRFAPCCGVATLRLQVSRFAPCCGVATLRLQVSCFAPCWGGCGDFAIITMPALWCGLQQVQPLQRERKRVSATGAKRPCNKREAQRRRRYSHSSGFRSAR